MNNRMKGTGVSESKTLMAIVSFFLQLLQEFHGEIGDVTMKVYGEESHKF